MTFFTRGLVLIAAVAAFSLSGFGQTAPLCTFGAVAANVHAEGLAEKIGTITLTCTGGTPGSLISSNLFISLNANVTNRLTASGTLANITVNANGFPSGAAPTLYSATTVAIGSVQYFVPTPNTVPAAITISGIRASMPSVTGGGVAIINATILSTGVQISNNQPAVLATGTFSLLNSVINSGIPCTNGSQAPATLDFPGLLAAGTSSSTIRITEGYANAFPPNTPPDPTADTGVRILVKLSSYGSNTQLYVPDAIVGSDGTAPTSSGAFNAYFSGGSYAPGQLLLIRVNGADATGAGGTLALASPGTAASFAYVTQLNMSSGVGYAVYEVVDGKPGQVEYAQIPVFVSVPSNSCATSSQASTLAPELAPVSNVTVSTPTDPIPRFVAATPASDCSVENDCNASYFPRLNVDQTPITLTSTSFGPSRQAEIYVSNSGTGQIVFNASLTYPAGQTQTSWLSITPTSGTNIANLTLTASPAALPQGQYLATININAGSAGTAAIPVTFNVGPVGVTIQSIVNSATGMAGAVPPDSFATIYGVNLNGTNVEAVFNGYPAKVVYDSAGQINVLVPSALNPSQPVGVYLTIDGNVSNTFRLTLTPNAPAIFTPGILNQNNSINTPAQPASKGDFVQIFLTGLTSPIAGPVTVNIGSQLNLPAVYAGAVTSIDGLEQVNVQVPAALAFSGNSTSLSICIPGGTQPLCSNSVSLYMQ